MKKKLNLFSDIRESFSQRNIQTNKRYLFMILVLVAFSTSLQSGGAVIVFVSQLKFKKFWSRFKILLLIINQVYTLQTDIFLTDRLLSYYQNNSSVIERSEIIIYLSITIGLLYPARKPMQQYLLSTDIQIGKDINFVVFFRFVTSELSPL